MEKRIICIECPKGCEMQVKDENGKVKITGNECPKGEKYAYSEIECPVRVLTTTIMTSKLKNRTVPVKTDKPVPRASMSGILSEIRKIRVNEPVHVDDVLVRDILGTGINVVATREVF